MRTLFFGTSSFAVPSLRTIAGRTELAGVVTQPDRPAGRGHKLTPSPVKIAARELGLPVYEPVNLRSFTRDVADEDFDFFALASYGRILPQALLDVPARGALNVHPSLLPKYRGATPIQTAIRNGDDESGVSVMLMDAGMDTGDLVLQRRIAIEPGETYGELHDRLAVLGATFLGEVVELANRGTLPRAPQTGEPSITKPLQRDDLTIEWSWSPERIVNSVRAFSPQPAARTTIDGETVKLLRAHVGNDGDVVIDELIAPNRGKMSGIAYEQSRLAALKLHAERSAQGEKG